MRLSSHIRYGNSGWQVDCSFALGLHHTDWERVDHSMGFVNNTFRGSWDNAQRGCFHRTRSGFLLTTASASLGFASCRGRDPREWKVEEAFPEPIRLE